MNIDEFQIVNNNFSLMDIPCKDRMKNEFNIDKEKKALNQILLKILDRGATYAINSLPVPDQVKNILKDIKNSLKKNGLENIISVAVNSAIEQGLEILNIEDDSKIKNMKQLFKVAEKGGLYFNIDMAIAILYGKYNPNITKHPAYDMYTERFRIYSLSNDFAKKSALAVKEYDEKVKEFLDECEEWYKKYENGNLDEAVEIAKDLKKKIKHVKGNEPCEARYNIIQGVAEMQRLRSDKITELEMQLCCNLS